MLSAGLAIPSVCLAMAARASCTRPCPSMPGHAQPWPAKRVDLIAGDWRMDGPSAIHCTTEHEARDEQMAMTAGERVARLLVVFSNLPSPYQVSGNI
jgi:hypothetical protein